MANEEFDAKDQGNMEDASVNDAEQSAKGKKKEKKSVVREILEWVVCIVAAVAVAFLIRAFIFEPVKVDGSSMQNTLQNGEIMLVTKYQYTELFGNPIFGNPKRGDVVICHYPNREDSHGMEMNFVKRVVGLPGDRVEMKEEMINVNGKFIDAGVLYVNGERQDEEYLTYHADYTFPEYVVPEGKYFVLGDHRNNSNDSHRIGPIDRNMIVGHVRVVLFPFNAWRSVK